MNRRLAVWLMVTQAALFAAETSLIHYIGPHASVLLLAFVRGAAGVVLAVVLGRHLGLRIMRTRQLPLQLYRGAVSLLNIWMMIYSFGHLPFADATAISFTQTAYIALFSVVILGESVGGAQWAASALGIAGALLISKPAFASWNVIYLVAFCGTGLNGLSFVLNRFLQREDSEATTMFYSNLVPALGSLPILLFQGLPVLNSLVWLPGLVIFGPLGMYAGIVAVKHAPASVLGPYTLLRLVIALGASLALFGEIPDLYSATGGGLIIASCLLSTGAPGITLLLFSITRRDPGLSPPTPCFYRKTRWLSRCDRAVRPLHKFG